MLLNLVPLLGPLRITYCAPHSLAHCTNPVYPKRADKQSIYIILESLPAFQVYFDATDTGNEITFVNTPWKYLSYSVSYFKIIIMSLQRENVFVSAFEGKLNISLFINNSKEQFKWFRWWRLFIRVVIGDPRAAWCRYCALHHQLIDTWERCLLLNNEIIEL